MPRGQLQKPKGHIWISPSQVKTWRDCQRKWGLRRINYIDEPTTTKQEWGTECHTLMEAWGEKGTPLPDTPQGNTCQQLIQEDWAPLPAMPGLLIEQEFLVPIPSLGEGVALYGFADFIIPPSTGKHLVSGDYKFTSDLRYALSEEELAKDPQALIYGAYGMGRFEKRTTIARWLYASASNPKPKVGHGGHMVQPPRKPNGKRRVQVIFGADSKEFLQGWEQLMDDLSDIVRAKREWKDALEDAEGSPTGCDKFGGCHYRKIGVCKLDGSQVLAHHVNSILSQCDDSDTNTNQGDGPMNLMDKINSMKSSTPAPAAQTAPAAAPEPEPNIAPPPAPAGDTPPLLAKLQNMAGSVNPPSEAPSAPVSTSEPAPAAAQPTPASPPATEPEKTPCPTCGKLFKHLGKHKCSVVAGVSAHTAVETQAASAAPTGTITFPDFNSQPTVPETPQQSAPRNDLTVIFDGAFLKNSTLSHNVVHLVDVMRPVMDAIAKDNGKEHWAMSGHYVDARTMLQAKFRKYISNGGVPKGAIILADSKSPDCQIVRDLLVEYAGVVIQGGL